MVFLGSPNIPSPSQPTPNRRKLGAGLGHRVLPLLAVHRQYLLVGQTEESSFQGCQSGSQSTRWNYWKQHLNNVQLSTKASASREALTLQNLTETACMGLRQTDRSRSLCSCYRNLEGRQTCVQITASDTTPARRLAQEKGLLFHLPLPQLSTASLFLITKLEIQLSHQITERWPGWNSMLQVQSRQEKRERG